MHALDLAVVARHPALWDALGDAFDAWHPDDPQRPTEGIGVLKPDFGPGYRIRALRHEGDPAALARWLDRHRPQYTVALTLARAMPGKHLDPGDIILSNAIPGFDWVARVGRGVGSGAEPEARVDAHLLRGALGLDAVDQRWTRQSRAPRPDGLRAPRLMTGGVASTTAPMPDTHTFDADGLRALTRRWPKLVAVEIDGVDLARVAARGDGRHRLALLASVVGRLDEPRPPDPGGLRYTVSNAVSFLRCWVRYAWPTRPASADTTQTPKGIRLGDEAVARRSTTDRLPQVERVPPSPAAPTTARRPVSEPPKPAPPRTRSGGIRIVDAESRASESGPRPRGSDSGTGSGPVSLRARLARLYPTADDAHRVMRDARLTDPSLDLTGGSDVRWHKILELARREPGGVERLLKVLVRDGH